MQSNKCKICRRLGTKLFLKGDRCLTPKCAMIKKPYKPGEPSKKRGRNISEYGKELAEKQKLKNWYNLSEKQFSNYVKAVLAKKGKSKNPVLVLIQKLEGRFDNVIFRLGFASSRTKARQLISHYHFYVNGKRMNIPSCQIVKGDKISINPSSMKKTVMIELAKNIKKYETPAWLRLDKEKVEAEMIGQASMEEALPPSEVSTIFEFYSR